MKLLKLFLILLFLTGGLTESINAQLVCKIVFCNCCGDDEAQFKLYDINGGYVGGPDNFPYGGCMNDDFAVNLTPGDAYFVRPYPDCEESGGDPWRTYFTACVCGDELDTVKVRCCPEDSDKMPKKSNTVTEYKLLQNLPNPFNPTTYITFELPEAANVTLTIFDVTGKVIVQPFDNNILQKGFHEYLFNADHNALSTGIYFYKLEAGNFTETKKMMLIK